MIDPNAYASKVDEVENLSKAVYLLRARVAAMQPVVDAALCWEAIPTIKTRADARALDNLVTAVDQYRMMSNISTER